MVERWLEEPSVGGSNPSITTLDPVDKLVKSSPFQGEDCEFEPRRGYYECGTAIPILRNHECNCSCWIGFECSSSGKDAPDEWGKQGFESLTFDNMDLRSNG